MTPAILVGVSLVVLLALLLTLRGRRRRGPGRHPTPSGAGVALAHALEGDHDKAAAVLEALVRAGGPGRGDAVVGLVAVLRAQGAHERAANLVEALAERGGADWIDAVRVRIALDRGRVARAAELAVGPGVPIDLALAALTRDRQYQRALDLYRARVKRKDRDVQVEATLVAGLAAAAARAGDVRMARKLARRASGLAADALAVACVGRSLHPKGAERERLAALLADRTRLPKPAAGWRIESGTSPDDAGTSEDREGALAVLRDHLDQQPTDWAARRVYGEWVLREGQPADWRSELAEVLAVLPQSADEEAGVAVCGHCGHSAEEAFFVCPRCDVFGSLEVRPQGRQAAHEARPSEKGATLAGLMLETTDDAGDLPS